MLTEEDTVMVEGTVNGPVVYKGCCAIWDLALVGRINTNNVICRYGILRHVCVRGLWWSRGLSLELCGAGEDGGVALVLFWDTNELALALSQGTKPQTN